MLNRQPMITFHPQRTCWVLPAVDYDWARAVFSPKARKAKKGSPGVGFAERALESTQPSGC